MPITQEKCPEPPPCAGAVAGQAGARQLSSPVPGGHPQAGGVHPAQLFGTGRASRLPLRPGTAADAEVLAVCLDRQEGGQAGARPQLREHPHLRGSRGQEERRPTEAEEGR